MSTTEQKILCLNSGGICAFPNCGKRLVNSFPDGEPTIVGQIAHIVAEQRQGPRGRSTLDDEARNKADNLILLCSEQSWKWVTSQTAYRWYSR